MMRFIQRIQKSFATLNAQYLVNKNRNALRFESQNINWNFQQINYQSQALIRGLTSMRFQPNDNFLLRVSPSQQAQSFITKLGTAGIGSKLFISTSTTQQQLDRQIKQHNISCFLFQPTVQIQDKKLIDMLFNLSPQLSKQQLGQPLKLANYPSLKCLIQTNFYSYPGVYKFRAIMNYASSKHFPLTPSLVQPITLPQSTNPIIITDPTNQFVFRTGVLNSLVNGRFLHIVERKNVQQVCRDVYNNKVDFITTIDTKIDDNVRVIVQKGSNLYQGRLNKVEI